MKAIALCLALLLAGCASTVEIPKEVQVPVPVPCVDQKDLPAPPAIASEAELLLMPRYERTLRLWIDHARLVTYQAQLEAIARRCSQLQPIQARGGVGLKLR